MKYSAQTLGRNMAEKGLQTGVDSQCNISYDQYEPGAKINWQFS